MIEQLPLFFDRKRQKYYLVGDYFVKDVIVIRHSWSRKHFEQKLLCLNSFNKEKEGVGVIIETRIAQIVNKRPTGCFHVLIQPPGLTDGQNRTVFSVADFSQENEEINDHTKLAGRESWEGVQIGLDPDAVANKNKALSCDEVDSFLLDMQNNKPVVEAIEYGKKREVGHDEH